MTAETVASGTVVLRVPVVMGGEGGGRTTELHDGVSDAHAFPESWNADLGLEEVDVELEEDVARYFLLCLGRET